MRVSPGPSRRRQLCGQRSRRVENPWISVKESRPRRPSIWRPLQGMMGIWLNKSADEWSLVKRMSEFVSVRCWDKTRRCWGKFPFHWHTLYHPCCPHSELRLSETQRSSCHRICKSMVKGASRTDPVSGVALWQMLLSGVVVASCWIAATRLDAAEFKETDGYLLIMGSLELKSIWKEEPAVFTWLSLHFVYIESLSHLQ